MGDDTANSRKQRLKQIHSLRSRQETKGNYFPKTVNHKSHKGGRGHTWSPGSLGNLNSSRDWEGQRKGEPSGPAQGPCPSEKSDIHRESEEVYNDEGVDRDGN